MRYIMNNTGAISPCIKEYEIETDIDLVKGTVVTVKDGFAKKAENGDVVLGIINENYHVEKRELEPRAGSGKVYVNVSPGMILACKDPEFAVASGTSTTVTFANDTMPSQEDAFKGGYIKLVSKGATSKNTDALNRTRRIIASSGTTFTVEQGGVPETGDVYAIIPPCGFDHLELNASSTNCVFSEASGNIKAVFSNPDSDFYEVSFKNTFFH